VGFAARRVAAHFGSELLGMRYALLGTAALTVLAIIPFARIRSAPPAVERRRFIEYLMARDFRLLWKLTFPGFLVGCGAGLTIRSSTSIFAIASTRTRSKSEPTSPFPRS